MKKKRIACVYLLLVGCWFVWTDSGQAQAVRSVETKGSIQMIGDPSPVVPPPPKGDCPVFEARPPLDGTKRPQRLPKTNTRSNPTWAVIGSVLAGFALYQGLKSVTINYVRGRTR